MQEPKRLRDDPSARSLLADDASFEPPTRAKGAVWASLGAMIGPSMPPTPTDPSGGGLPGDPGGAAAGASQGATGATAAAGAAKGASGAAGAAGVAKGAAGALEAAGASKGAVGALKAAGALKGATGVVGAAGAIKGATGLAGVFKAVGAAGVAKVVLAGALTSGAVGVALWRETPRQTSSAVESVGASASASATSFTSPATLGSSLFRPAEPPRRASSASDAEALREGPSEPEGEAAKAEAGSPPDTSNAMARPSDSVAVAHPSGPALANTRPGGPALANTRPSGPVAVLDRARDERGIVAAGGELKAPETKTLETKTLETKGQGAAPSTAMSAEGAAETSAAVSSSVVASSAPPVASAPVASSAPPVASAPAFSNDLREESGLVRQARARLRVGDGRGALEVLEAMNKRFGRGGLGQERELLTVEAFAATSQHGRAAERAEALLREHPASPYADRLRRIVEIARRDANGERVRTPTERRR